MPSPEARPSPILEKLRRALAAPPPDAGALDAMAPEYAGPSYRCATEDCRPAAVLVLLYPSEGTIRFPLMLRPEDQGPHGGQISLPGGSLEAGETPARAALREAWEELGVPPSSVELIGELSELVVPSSRFRVIPFVGWAPERPDFSPSAAEVAELFEPSLAELLDPESRRSGERVLQGKSWAIPYYALAGRQVWGATARALSELKAALLGAGLEAPPSAR